MVVLVTVKNDEDPIKNEGTRARATVEAELKVTGRK